MPMILLKVLVQIMDLKHKNIIENSKSTNSNGTSSFICSISQQLQAGLHFPKLTFSIQIKNLQERKGKENHQKSIDTQFSKRPKLKISTAKMNLPKLI